MAQPQQAGRLDILRPWRARARKATPGPHRRRSRIAAELEQAYLDGMKRAAAFVEEKGQRELATLVRRLAEVAS